MSTKDKCLGAFLGLAIGDAMGAPAEFSQRGEFEPITEYTAGGIFDLPAGYWTDDTSMAICLAESILSREGGMDLNDQMRRYSNWYLYGSNSSTGACFDTGNGTRLAIENFLCDGLRLYPSQSGGNGSLMRLAPVSIAHRGVPEEVAVRACVLSSSPTHNKHASKLCGKLGSYLHRFMNGSDEKPVVPVDKVENSGEAKASLLASLHHFGSTNTFEEAILQAVNYGGDADTIGAITGQLAGSYYGLSGIPDEWILGLYDHNRLLDIAERLYSLGNQPEAK